MRFSKTIKQTVLASMENEEEIQVILKPNVDSFPHNLFTL